MYVNKEFYKNMLFEKASVIKVIVLRVHMYPIYIYIQKNTRNFCKTYFAQIVVAQIRTFFMASASNDVRRNISQSVCHGALLCT